MAKTALSKEPKVESDPRKAKALEAYNRGIRMLKKYPPGHPRRAIGEKLINQAGPQTGLPDWNKALQTPAGKDAKKPTPEQKFAGKTPEQQRDVLTDEAGYFAKKNLDRGQAFDPNNPFTGYEMGFGQARDKAYGDVMSQFERTMQPEFQRQQQEFQQRMADSGLDPGSKAYQDQYKMMADAQSNARLNAQSQASQQAYEVQQQAFNQGQSAANMPWQWQQIANPYFMTPWEQAGNVNLANVQGQWNMKQTEAQKAGQLAAANIAAGTSRANTQAQIDADNERWRRENVARMDQGQNQNNGFVNGVQSGLPGGIATGGMSGRR